MDQLFALVAYRLGISPEMLPVYIGVIIALANVGGKSIPVSATGPLGVLRKICLVIGLYVPQKITPGVSTKTVAASIAATLPDTVIQEASDQLTDSVKGGGVGGNVATALADVANDSVVSAEPRAVGPFEAQRDKETLDE